jgi:hypothetical protein
MGIHGGTVAALSEIVREMQMVIKTDKDLMKAGMRGWLTPLLSLKNLPRNQMNLRAAELRGIS